MDKKNLIITIVLSALIMVGWQYFYEMPRMKQQQAIQAQQAAQQKLEQPAAQSAPSGATGGATTSAAPAGAGTGAVLKTREEALAQSPRTAIDTPRIHGSIALKGGRLDDLVLKDYRETVDPTSPEVVLLSPSGGPGAVEPVRRTGGAFRRSGLHLRRCRREAAELRYGLAIRRRHAVGRSSGDAELGQRRRPHLQAHLLGRSELSLHRRAERREQGCQPGLRRAVFAGRGVRPAQGLCRAGDPRRLDRGARRHAAGRRLLQQSLGLQGDPHPCGRSSGRCRDLQGGQHGRLGRHHQQVLVGRLGHPP